MDFISVTHANHEDSLFKPYIIRVTSIPDVRNAYLAMHRRELIKARHTVMAYNLATPEKSGYADDEEDRAARPLMYLLKEEKVNQCCSVYC